MHKTLKICTISALAGFLLFGPNRAGHSQSAKDQSCQASSQVQHARFRVFDGTTFKDKPDLSAFGMEPVDIVYEEKLFAEDSLPDAMPTDATVQEVANSAKTAKGIMILDVERWYPLPDAAQRYVGLVQRLKALSPGLKTGYYAVVPERDHWRAFEGPGSVTFRQWQQENDKLQAVADCADYLFPSLYTFYDDQQGWVAFAEANIMEARRLARGKPVYVFLWPTYHDFNAILKGKPIPPDFWRLELETARRLADGVVIWGGAHWDPQAPWWQETMDFLITLKTEYEK